MKQKKFIVAICATVLSLALLICASIYIDATLNSTYGIGRYQDEIDAVKYELNAAKYAEKNGHWEDEFYIDWFGDSSYPSQGQGDWEDIRSYKSVKAELQNELKEMRYIYNSAIGLPLCVLILSLSLFLGSGAFLAVEAIGLAGAKSGKKAKGKAAVEDNAAAASSDGEATVEEQAQDEAYADAPEALECPECGGTVPVVKGQAILTCDKCGTQYQNPYEG